MVEQVDALTGALPALELRRDELADIELQLLIDALLRYGGYDLRGMNQAVLRRRIADVMRAESIATISGLQDRLLHDERMLASFLVMMSGGAAQLFHDPPFLKAFALHVVPLLQTYSFVRIWVPGSGIGATAYSLAAILDEAGILDRSVIYATTLNDVAASVSKAGVYAHASEADLIASMRQAGLVSPVSRFFETTKLQAFPVDRLRQSVMFARHSPAEDGPINEFHAIVARGIFPAFNGSIQYRLHRLAYDSLLHLGFLCLGQRESLAGTVHERAFRNVVPGQPIYRKMR